MVTSVVARDTAERVRNARLDAIQRSSGAAPESARRVEPRAPRVIGKVAAEPSLTVLIKGRRPHVIQSARNSLCAGEVPEVAAVRHDADAWCAPNNDVLHAANEEPADADYRLPEVVVRPPFFPGAHASRPWFLPPHEHSQTWPFEVRHFAPHLCSVAMPLRSLAFIIEPQHITTGPMPPMLTIGQSVPARDSGHRCVHLRLPVAAPRRRPDYCSHANEAGNG